VIDVWVKAGEPPYFAEWGFFDWHVVIGFVKAMEFPAPGGSNGGYLSSQNVGLKVPQNHIPQTAGVDSGGVRTRSVNGQDVQRRASGRAPRLPCPLPPSGGWSPRGPGPPCGSG